MTRRLDPHVGLGAAAAVVLVLWLMRERKSRD